ncbi:hypothetical protein [Helicobacter pylori]|nr:hypothetical protein [Helicobacter pylori]
MIKLCEATYNDAVFSFDLNSLTKIIESMLKQCGLDYEIDKLRM